MPLYFKRTFFEGRMCFILLVAQETWLPHSHACCSPPCWLRGHPRDAGARTSLVGAWYAALFTPRSGILARLGLEINVDLPLEVIIRISSIGGMCRDGAWKAGRHAGALVSFFSAANSDKFQLVALHPLRRAGKVSEALELIIRIPSLGVVCRDGTTKVGSSFFCHTGVLFSSSFSAAKSNKFQLVAPHPLRRVAKVSEVLHLRMIASSLPTNVVRL